MAKIVLAILFTLATGVLTVNAQTSGAKKPTPPTTDQDVNRPDDEDVVFPPDVVDTTLNNTSEVKDIKVDSTMKMEDKKTYEEKEKMKKGKSNKMKKSSK
jgi:hypothetical protein